MADAIAKTGTAAPSHGFTPRFLLSEWRHIVDAWQIADVDDYTRVPRLGRKVRGRYSTLTVNYRTSHRIRRMADKLLLNAVRDVDDNADERDRTVSVFNGPQPELQLVGTEVEETEAVSAWIAQVATSGLLPGEIGIFVRTRAQRARARTAVEAAGYPWLELSERDQEADGHVLLGPMELAKGLEFKAVAVMACDDGVLPLQARMAEAADETELDDVYETERHLFYVACTRARDRLVISAVRPSSEFIKNLRAAG